MEILKFIFNIRNFIKPILDYNFPGLIKGNYIIKMKSGLKFFIRPKIKGVVSDIDIFKEVIIDDEYQIKKLVKEGDIVLDVGANVGFFSLFVQHKIPRVKMFSYEPFIDNFNILKKNVSINNIHNIYPFQRAVLSKKKRSFLFVSKNNTGAHSIFNSGTGKRCYVNSESFSNILKTKKPNIIKIDCEGAEYEILLNTNKSVLRNVNKMIIEQHITPETKKHFKKESIISYLKKSGFKSEIIKKIYYPDEGEFWIIKAMRESNKS